MASESNEIITALKIIGAGEYSRLAHSAAQSVREIDNQQTRAERSARRLGERMDLMSGQIGRGLGRGATIAATFGAGLVKAGLNFDAMIERSQIGNETLLKSSDAAQKMTDRVREFALQAPLFGVEQMMKTSQQLLGADYSKKSIIPTLTTFSDTLSALGRRPEDLQRLSYAFSQMMQKGQISAEELRGQLGEIFPAQKILARELGMSTDEFAKKMKEGSFKGKKYINLLLRGMAEDFGGATSKMATTFDGQLANIRESAKYTLGILFKPLFFYLEKDAFPALKYFGDETVATMNDVSLTSEEKFKKIKESADFWLMPMWEDFKNELGKVDWGTQIAKLSDTLAPLLGQAFSEVGKQTAKALLIGFRDADIWGKTLIASVIISKMGLWGPLFGALGKAFGKRMGTKVAAEAAAATTSGEALGRIGAAGTTAGNRWGRAFTAATRATAIIGVGLVLTDIAKQARDTIREIEGHGKYDEKSNRGRVPWDPTSESPLGWETTKNVGGAIWDWFARRAKSGAQGRQHGGPVSMGQPYVVGERGPELFVPHSSGNIKPSLGGMTLNSYIVLDGRIAAKSVAKHNFNELARK